MGSLNNSDVTDVKKEVKVIGSDKDSKPKIVFTRVTKEELERRRIPVYPYII